MSMINKIKKHLRLKSERKSKVRMGAVQSNLVDRINTASQEFKFDPKPFTDLIERDIGKLQTLETDMKNKDYRVVIFESEGNLNHCIIRICFKKTPIDYVFKLTKLNDIMITKEISVDWLMK